MALKRRQFTDPITCKCVRVASRARPDTKDSQVALLTRCWVPITAIKHRAKRRLTQAENRNVTMKSHRVMPLLICMSRHRGSNYNFIRIKNIIVSGWLIGRVTRLVCSGDIVLHTQAIASVCVCRQCSQTETHRHSQLGPRVKPFSKSWLFIRALCRIKLLPVTCFGGHMDVNC